MGKRIETSPRSHRQHLALQYHHSASWGVHPASHCQSPDPALPYSPAAATVHRPASIQSFIGVFPESWCVSGTGVYHFCRGRCAKRARSPQPHPCPPSSPSPSLSIILLRRPGRRLYERPDGCNAEAARVERRTSSAAAGELCSSRAPPPPRPPSAARADAEGQSK
jgi:hypothetical protein